MSVIFQASNGIMAASLLGSSSHLITAMIGGGGGERLARASRLMRLVHRLVLYRGINGGEWGGRTKQAREHKRTGENGTRNRAKNGTRTARQRGAKPKRKRTDGVSKQEETTRACGNHAQEQKRQSSFSPDPLTIGSRRFAGLKCSPAPRGVG